MSSHRKYTYFLSPSTPDGKRQPFAQEYWKPVPCTLSFFSLQEKDAYGNQRKGWQVEIENYPRTRIFKSRAAALAWINKNRAPVRAERSDKGKPRKPMSEETKAKIRASTAERKAKKNP